MAVERTWADPDPEVALASGPAALLHELLNWAVLAPSPLNTQPWIFEIAGDEVAVHGDGSRSLPQADPDGRQLVMACGAAVLNLRVAGAKYGHATSVEVPATVRSDRLFARVRLEERCRPTEKEETLFAAIPRRRTNRLALDGRDPPEGLIAALGREARREGAFLEPVEPHQRAAVAEIVSEADRRKWADPRFRAELASWTRPNKSARRDGIFGWSQGMGDAASLLEPLRVRISGRGREQAENDRRRTLATPALLVLSTSDDGPAQWLAAGEALERVLLLAAAVGLDVYFLSHLIEHPDLRRRLAEAAGAAGRPQALFRLGYGADVRSPPRRLVDEVVRDYAPTAKPRAPLVLRKRSPSA